jgi:hypothetical protein
MAEVANKLAIVPGGKIKVPGVEPSTAITSSKLAEEMQEINLLKQSMLSVARALELVPGSRVEFGAIPSERWFVLPDGPPPDYGECCRYGDWYALLRAAAAEEEPEEPECDSFDYRGRCGDL